MSEQAAYRPTGEHHRPFGSEAAELPRQYLQALFKPAPKTFASVAERAHWRLVWFQILLLIIIPAALGLLRGADRSLAARLATHSRFLYDILVAFTFGLSLAGLIVRTLAVPLFFFLTVTIQYLVARTLRGRGSYVGQSHAMLVYQVPLAILANIINTIVVFVHGIDLRSIMPLVSIVLFFYGVLLNITMLMGVHRLAKGRAIGVVITYYVVLALIVVGLLILLTRFIISTVHNIG